MKHRLTFTVGVATALALSTALSPLIVSAQMLHPIFRIAGQDSASSTTSTDGGVRPTFRTRLGLRAGVTASGTALRVRAEANASTSVRIARREMHLNGVLTRAKERAGFEIDRRVTLLQKFATRIGNVRMADADKATLQATLQTQITSLTNLKAQIAANTATSSLRTDIQSIAKSYRIFALVIPQSAITAAADRVNQIISQMQEFSGKLETRVNAAGAAGANVSALATALTDFNAKVADARVQATAAVNEVNVLKPDNGNQGVFQSNQAALKDARTKIDAARADLRTARQDAGTIVRGLISISSTGTSASVTASTTASTTAQ
ncbi:MAG: hypothetical protein B7X04_03300 [Parcubacteria group bacterium 21-54-25]|nr:MAG: hypothetical protein B7X04_03300 [Parcubacteria group bacterium 21-54-25]HQU08044.1 hypothetical protein [Candidatus Paceibacterota bacterium]